MKKLNLLLLLLGLCFTLSIPLAHAQVDPDEVGEFDPDEFNEYSDTQEPPKRFCTQKVNGLSPTQLISIGYEVQFPFSIKSTPEEPEEGGNLLSLGEGNSEVQLVHGVQLGANFPIISKNSVIVNLSLNYNESRFIFDELEDYSFHQNLSEFGLRTGGVGFTVFKPLNEKNFLIFQGSADMNSNFTTSQEDFDFGNSMTYSGAVVFGWKKSDDLMWGIGATRTYRGGEVLYIPIIMYNKTFNDRWGVEILAPARMHLRRNFSTKSLLMLGYEIVGNSYFIQNLPNETSDMRNFNELHLRRSEIKARLMFQRSIKNFIWLSVQGGVRLNYKFNVSASESTDNGDFLITNELGNPLYFNVSLNLVSP